MTTGQKKTNFGMIMAVYLLGIFMGAIDTGIVTPARTIIQNSLSVDDKTGIWLITIYTLAYAASIPIMGKLADKYGRKYIYLASIFLFGVGSLLCGLSEGIGSFTFLLVARAIQAIGGGGILPVATAEFGTTFPPEKRGMALGLVGGVYGIANIFGASAGSLILDIFGVDNWQFIFYINIPITIFILIAGFIALSNNKEKNIKKIDVFGILILTSMVLCLLYGLKNIDFFDFINTLLNIKVYPFLIASVVLLPLFIIAEKKAEDPVLNLAYFKNAKILITLILSLITGIAMMGMIFVPQFSENALKVATGSGGYFVIILGVFAGIGAPLSGKMIDKFGVRLVLGIGFIAAFVGSLYIMFITANFPTVLNVVISLILVGLGIGFTMGTPLNYMMLDNTKKEESNSALATLSLVRSIGTAVAPAIMVGFIAHAGASVQTNVMALMPKEVNVPELPYSQQLTEEFDKLKSDPKTADKFKDINIPDLTSMQTVNINMNGNSGYTLPEDLVDLMKSSDVTTMTANAKIFADRMFDEMTPDIMNKIESGIDKGLSGIKKAKSQLKDNINEMQKGYDGISTEISQMQAAVSGQKKAVEQLNQVKQMLKAMQPKAQNVAGKMPEGVSIGQGAMPTGMQTGTPPMPPQKTTQKKSIADMMPESVKAKMPKEAVAELEKIQTTKQLDEKITALNNAIDKLNKSIEKSKQQRVKLIEGVNGIKTAQKKMDDTIFKMGKLKEAVPGAFDTARLNYINAIELKNADIENEFQKTLNTGFAQVYATVAVVSLIGFILLLFYKEN